MGTLDMGIP